MSTALRKKIIFICAGLILVFAAVLSLFLLPEQLAVAALPENAHFTLTESETGRLTLSWTADSGRADGYCLKIYAASPESDGGDYPGYEEISERHFDTTSCSIPDELRGEDVIFCLRTYREYWHPGENRLRLSSDSLEAELRLTPPAANGCQVLPSPESSSVTLSWNGSASLYHVCRMTGDGYELLQTLENGEKSCVLSFGAEGLELPDYDFPELFTIDAVLETESLTFRGAHSAAVSVDREDLLGTGLRLTVDGGDDNVFSLSWNETKGRRYDIQLSRNGGEWETLSSVDCRDEHRYTTPHLPSFENVRFRVLAVGGKVTSGSPLCSQEESASTRESVTYATVWPLTELEVWSSPGSGSVIGTAPAASAYCVLAEDGGYFRIRFGDTEGYISSQLCMINLPDYIGNLCSYDITNSYSSLYMVHEFEIPDVTDTVITGYEHVRLSGGDYLVPLLYPTAKKLIPAAEAALEQGFRIRIYDSFRPQQATRSIYDKTLSIINEPLPESPFTDVSVGDLPSYEGRQTTYYDLVTDGTYDLGNFLARSGSMHNMGIAMDLTLEASDSREELNMQTSMHDLSWYSILTRNNQNANMLGEIMRSAGFGGLTSEWWHFQDNDTRREQNLNSYLWSGVSPECWVKDDFGWRYRLSDGSFLSGTSAEIDGTACTFDSAGYVEN